MLRDPANHDLLAVVKGARNGAVYGAKVRFPHALVMVFLFRSGTFRDKVDLVFRATRTHARNLAKFATIYKLMCYALKHYGPTPGKEGECFLSVPVYLYIPREGGKSRWLSGLVKCMEMVYCQRWVG